MKNHNYTYFIRRLRIVEIGQEHKKGPIFNHAILVRTQRRRFKAYNF